DALLLSPLGHPGLVLHRDHRSRGRYDEPSTGAVSPSRAWKTEAVAYHETFWVVTGTEAPVVGLAVIVQISDVIRAINKDRDHPWAQTERYSTAMLGVVAWSVINLALMG